MARGQATAIGAVFLVIIIALSLSYVVWAIAQIRELNKSLVKAISIREEYRRENLMFSDYEYYDYSNITCSSVDGSFVSTCIEIGEETYTESNTLVNDSLKNTTSWRCLYTDKSTRWLIFTCLKRQVGFQASIIWKIGQLTCWGEGEWGRTVGFDYNPAPGDKVYLYLDYTIIDYLVDNADVHWTLKICIVTPDGEYWYGVKASGQAINITDTMVYSGTYYLRIYSRVNIYLKRGAYIGELRCNSLRIIVCKHISVKELTLCKTSVVYHFDFPSTPILSSFILQGKVDNPIKLCTLYYDNTHSLWQYAGCFLIDANKTFNIRMDIDPTKIYEGKMSIMLSMEGSEPFELSANEALMECGFLSDKLNVTVKNVYSLPIKIVSIWIINSTNVWRFPQSTTLLPGEEEIFELPVRLSLDSMYTIRVVTERGNIFDATIKT